MSQGDYESEVHVYDLVTHNAENINRAMNRSGAQSHKTSWDGAKRRRIDNAPKDGEVSLIFRHIDLTPNKSEDCKSLLNSIERNLENVCVDIPVEVEFSANDLLEDLPQVSSLQVFDSGESMAPLLTLNLKLSSISSEGRRDIIWAQEIKYQKKTTKGYEKMAGLAHSYHLRFSSEKVWLVVKVMMPATNYWSQQLIQRSGDFWYKLLAEAFPNGGPKVEKASVITPRDFYTSGHVPDKAETIPSSVQHPVLKCQLMPYQRRTVRWMIQREGMDLQEGVSSPIQYKENSDDLPPTFFAGIDKEGRRCHVSHVLGMVSTSLSALHQVNDCPHGGILAEEMGLGKTVELIALMSLNQMPASRDDNWNIGATLIISPPGILEQWKNEIEMHAPDIKVFHYEGMKAYKKLKTAGLIKAFAEHDVILTTYAVLSSEIHYAQPDSGRKMRGNKKYIANKCPLVEVCWWRVCLDEAQMVDGGYSNASVVARMIPRVNAWAVTGTAIRKDIYDLHGLLKFLNYEPFCGRDKLVFNRLVSYNHDAFRSLFKSITLRHTKAIVRDEIVLPLQKRVIVTVPFSTVEQQNYSHLLEQMRADCGVDENGAPVTENWIPNKDMMRSWLTRLRQTCSHPQAGEKNRRVFGIKGPLRTVEEVLDVMIEQHANTLRNDERALFETIIQRGQFYGHIDKFESALDTWMDALKEVQKIVAECREALTQEAVAQPKVSRVEPEAKDLSLPIEDVDNGEDGENLKAGRVSGLKNRLRSFLDIEHACLFWIGTAYFNLKAKAEINNPDGEKFKEYQDLEEDYYHRAKLVRKEIMSETQNKALKLINNLRDKAGLQDFVGVPDMDLPSTTGGIESRNHLDDICQLFNALNEQVMTLDDWREKLVMLLTKSMMDENENEELKGDEFEVSVMDQELSERYMTAIRGLIADREEALQGIPNLLVQHDIQNDLVRAGTYQDQLRMLIAKKEILKPKRDLGFLRAHITQLRSVATNLKIKEQAGSERVRVERAFLEKELKQVHKIMVAHSKINADLAREMEMMRNVINARKDYYRQVQDISDTVAPFDAEEVSGKRKIDSGFFADMLKTEAALARKISEAKAKSRYLSHLKDQGKDESPECLICRDSYAMGILTTCGHEFCTECMTSWFKASRKCPACNVHLSLKTVFQISYKPKEPTMHEETNSETSRQSSPGIYADVDDRILNEIKRIDLKSYFGSKIDMIVRHLLWLKMNEPGFKAVIFSQWGDFLDFMKTVLSQANIGFATVEKKGGVERFKTDPDCHCFFLHAKSQSSGLTLVNATHVFLCEPLVNVSLELQAISRVHRIGQTRPTTVWLYVVSGTVEQSVLDVSTRHRLALMEKTSGEGLGEEEEEGGALEDSGDGVGEERPKRRSLASSPHTLKAPLSADQLDVANSEELQRGLGGLVEKSPGGGEMVDDEDLWVCLFGGQKGEVRGKATEELIRRELLAGAAEGRMAAES